MIDVARTIRVMVVDDHPIVRHGLVSLLEDRPGVLVVAEAGSAAEAALRFREREPDVTLMDAQLPDGSGVDLIASLLRERPEARFIVLTTFEGDALVEQAFRAGARAFVLKSTICGDIVDTIKQVDSGEWRVPEEIGRKLAERLLNPVLTPRELDVLRLVARGSSNKEIAAALGLAPATIKTHLDRIFEKLRVGDRTHAVTAALQKGLIRPPF